MISKKQLVAIRLKTKTICEVKKIAEEKEISVSEYLRNIIENHLSSR